MGASRASVRAATSIPDALDGQVILVTGSTDGIGRHTARQLKERGATVLVHGRSVLRAHHGQPLGAPRVEQLYATVRTSGKEDRLWRR